MSKARKRCCQQEEEDAIYISLNGFYSYFIESQTSELVTVGRVFLCVVDAKVILAMNLEDPDEIKP